MKTTNKLIIGLLLFSVTLLNSCKKGDDGIDGKDGKDGNANVTSMILTTSVWDWDGTNYWRWADWSGISILTPEVCNTGAVMLYQKFSDGSYIQLPITINITGSMQEHDFFTFLPNQIVIIIENSDLSDPNPPPSDYKLVCIPQKAMLSHPNLDIKNYDAVRTAFNLKD